MAALGFRVEDRRFLYGCSAGLNQRTAVVELSVSGSFARDALADTVLRARAVALNPSEPLHGVTDWPADFLVQADAPAAGEEDLYWLGSWVVALTVAVQRWGHDPLFRGRVCGAGGGRLELAIPWAGQEFFDEALSLALRLVSEWLKPDQASPDSGAPWRTWLAGDVPASRLDQYFGGRLTMIQSQGLVPMALRFIEAAVRRRMPFETLPNYVQIGWGANAERLDWALTGRTSWMAMGIAKNKAKTGRALAEAGIPVPRAALVDDADQALRAAHEFGWPVVVKPRNHDGGGGVEVGIVDADRLVRAFHEAQRISPGAVLLEQHCPGEDHRLLVVHGRVLQVARRKPPQIVGDGVRTVGQLVDELNSDTRRGPDEKNSLLKIVTLDGDARAYLAEQGFAPDSVPAGGQMVRLARIANISAGGTAQDVTEIAHPDNVALAARAARIVGLDIAGVDFLCPDISRSWHEVGGVICEVNGQPGFRPHWLADPDRDINGEVLDVLFEGRPARVPTAAITGTNGKTTTAEMLYRIWTAAGKVTGVCTTVRVRIGDQTVSTDNLSGQPGARLILNDPAVEAAVLEMPRKGLIIFGHHCDRYDVAALLNVQQDHIGLDGIESLEQMAELKAEVLERATGAIVVNAEDPLCLAMRARAGTDRHILVSRTPEVAAVVEHRREGGEAVFIDERQGRPWIILASGASDIELMPVHEIPATLNGLLAFNESNAMFAAALAWAQGIDTETIRRALGSFRNTVEQNPGRYNFIEGLPFDVLVDFAHNPDGVRGLCSVAAAMPVAGRRLVGSLNFGSRNPGFIAAMAPVLAETFDEFVLSCDPELVVQCAEYAGHEPAAVMVANYRDRLLEHGVQPERITCEVDRLQATRAAFHRAGPGDLVVLLAYLDHVLPVVDELRSDPGTAGVRNR